jgi:hypothetical protein
MREARFMIETPSHDDPWSYIQDWDVELLALCGPLLEDPQCMEWHGIEMFWGRKAS